VLILDEPFGACRRDYQEEELQEVLKIWRDHKVTVLMITHDIDEALVLGDRLVMMTNGPPPKSMMFLPRPAYQHPGRP